MKTEWILCPFCGSKTRNKVREDTILENYPLYCPKCKQESMIKAKGLEITIIKEPVTLVGSETNSLIKNLIGNSMEFNLSLFDYYIRDSLGIFIPILERIGNRAINHKHPAYEIIINFDVHSFMPKLYHAEITSPNILHNNAQNMYCYYIFIDKDYFEKRFLMYSKEIPVFECKQFEMCSDILKVLNMFVFEYSKCMMNAELTLEAQTEIITHWLIRSLFGETMDMRAISSDYSLARAQYYIEQHYMDNITVEKLANLGYMSKTSFNRWFKKELGITPIEYLIEVRIKMAKLMLKRKENQITEIAMRCGFGSSAHFSSCFQKHVGLTPSEYREKYND